MTASENETRIRQALRDFREGKLSEDAAIAIWAAAVTDELAETRGELEAARVGALVEPHIKRDRPN